MYANQLTETCHGTVGVLLLIFGGLFMIWSGWAALRDPEHARFWTDATGVWLTKHLYGETAAAELDRRLRDESRIRQSGVVGIVTGIFFVMSAVVVLLLSALGIL